MNLQNVYEYVFLQIDHKFSKKRNNISSFYSSYILHCGLFMRYSVNILLIILSNSYSLKWSKNTFDFTLRMVYYN